MFLFLFELSPHNLKSVRYFDSATLKNPIKQLQQIKYKSLVSLMTKNIKKPDVLGSQFQVFF